MRTLLGLALAAAALACARLLTPAAAVELLGNGGFENGADGWGAVSNLDIVCDQGTAATGECAALLTAPGPGSVFLQHHAVPVEPGGVYTLSASVLKNDPRAESVRLYVMWRDANGNTIDLAQAPQLFEDAPSYRLLSVGPVATLPNVATAAVFVQVAAAAGGARVYVDDVHLEGPAPSSPTPAPATITPPAGAPTGTATLTTTAAPTMTAVATLTRTATPTPSPVPIPEGYLINGGFEETAEGTLLGWKNYGGVLAQTAERRHSGNFSAIFYSDTDSTKWVYQTVRVRPEKAYIFEGHVLVEDPAVERASLRVSWYASDDGSGSAISTADSVASLGCCDPSFRHITTEPLSPPPGARTARFRVMLQPVSAAAARIYLDDMGLHETTAAFPASVTPAAGTAPEDGEPTHEALSATRAPSRGAPATGVPALPVEGSPHRIRINEALYAPAERRAGEWLELYNAGDSPLRLEGWKIADNRDVDPLPPLTLPAGGFAIVAADDTAFRDAYDGFQGTLVTVEDGEIGNGLADDGDRLVLVDDSGRLADALSYGNDSSVFSPPVPAVASGHSIERSPPGRDTDQAADFVDNASPSPGAAISDRREAPAAGSEMSLAPASLMSTSRSQSTRAGEGSPWGWAAVGCGLLLLCVASGGAAAARLRSRRNAP